MPLQDLTIENNTRRPRIPRSKIAAAVKMACAECKKRISATIVFVADREMRNLHSRYMRDPSPTDVLTFVLSETPDSLETEIYIGSGAAAAQARTYGESEATELTRLAVHGLLHSIGYDDRTPLKRRAMWKKQETIVARAVKRNARKR